MIDITKQDHLNAIGFLKHMHPANYETDETRRAWLMAIYIISQSMKCCDALPVENESQLER